MNITDDILKHVQQGSITGTGAIILAYLRSLDNAERVTNREMAELIGCTKANISKIMRQFRKSGLIAITIDDGCSRHLRLL